MRNNASLYLRKAPIWIGRCLVLALVLLLVTATGVEAKKKKKKKKKKKAAAPVAETTGSTAPAAGAARTPSPAARKIDKKLLAYDTAAARSLLSEVMDEADVDLVIARGRMLEQEQDYAGAEADLEAAAARVPNDPAPLVHLGESLLHAKKKAAADSAFSRAADRARARLAANAGDADALYYLGVAEQRLRRFDDALARLEQARQLRPSDPLILFQLGATHAFLEQWGPAVENLDRAIAMDTGIAYAYFYRGMAASKIGRKDLLVNDMHRFLDLAPESPEAPTARKILEAAY